MPVLLEALKTLPLRPAENPTPQQVLPMLPRSDRHREDKADLPLFQKQHAVISTRLRAGRTLIHVYAEGDPGMGFEEAHASLEDVYFATIAGRHNIQAGNC